MNKNIRCREYRRTIKNLIIIMFALAISVTAVFELTKIVTLVNEYGFQDLLSLYEKNAKLIYFAICFMQPIILPLPEPITIMGGSTVLGSLNGAFIGFSGTFLGIIVMFFISKYAGRAVINKLIDKKKLEKFNKFIQKNEMLVILMLFILPILPDEIICAGAGLAGISTFKFIGVAAIAKLVTSVSLSYSIQFIKFNSVTFMVIIIAALGVLLLRKAKQHHG